MGQKLEFSELLRRKLGPLVLRGLSGEQPDWGSFRLKYNSLSQKCRFYGIFASSLKTREPRAAAPPVLSKGIATGGIAALAMTAYMNCSIN